MFFPWQDADDAQARGKAQERDAGTETASNKLTLLYMMGTAGVNPEKTQPIVPTLDRCE